MANMIQKDFAMRVRDILLEDETVTGLAVGGSWLTGDMDEYSDLDLLLVTKEKVSEDKDRMLAYARGFGTLLTAFTGEHVGEPRLLICLYDDPLLHVDIKFVTVAEFGVRVENPEILLDKEGDLTRSIGITESLFPFPDYQWIEDRFWTWAHYALAKVGRGEYFEAIDFLGFVRMVVLGPLLHISNDNLPRGVRKVETMLAPGQLEQLRETLGEHDRNSLIAAIESAVGLYRGLRVRLFRPEITLHKAAEERVMGFLDQIKKGKVEMS